MNPQQLNTGATIPLIGFGTGQLANDDAFEAVGTALTAGYRLIDTASRYDNEVGIGYALRNAGIPREELFITTKLWNDDHGYNSALKAFDNSLLKLGLEYVDLYLIHWPSSPKRLESWRALEEIYHSGRAKAIGVSNFTPDHLRELLHHASVTPAVNQIEFHPFVYDAQLPIVAFCREQDIVVEGYSPLGEGRHLKHPVVEAVAKKCGRTPAQVLIRWSMQHDIVPLARSHRSEHIIQNFEALDFTLKAEDMAALDGVSDGTRIFPNPYLID